MARASLAARGGRVGRRAARALAAAAGAAALVFLLAAAPILVAAKDGMPVLAPKALFEALAGWVRGLSDGESFRYVVGTTSWSLLEEAPLFLAVSFANLAVPGAAGVFLGALAGTVLRPRRRGWQDRAVDAFAATPDFIVALAAQAVAIGILAPLGLRIRIGPGRAGLSLLGLAVMGIYPFCFAYRAAARASRSVEGSDYVAYARSKGLSEREILRRHVGAAVVPALANELPTILSFMQGTLFIVEYLFGLPGVARFLFSAAFSGRRRGFYEVYQYDLGVFVLAGLGLAYALVYAFVRLALALARKALAHE